MNRRRVAAAVLAAALVIPAVVGALMAWGGRTAEPVDGAAALREFVAGLQGARDRTFTAVYATRAGVAVTSAQDPTRLAYRSAAGLYVAGPDATYLCRTPGGERAACRRAPGSDTVPLSHARALSGVLDGDFIAPELVRAYISRLAARSPVVRRSSRTTAGQEVHCVGVARTFDACATSTGVLAYFDAPDGRLTLTRYRPDAAAELFALPTGATITDLDESR